jgi:hypothetical protein
MVKRFFLALMAMQLVFASFASAAPKPTDVLDYVPVAVNYAAGTTANVLGDGTATAGIPPAVALPDVPTTETGWTIATGAQPLTTANGGSAPEKKFRTLISGITKILFDDAIRNFSQPGASHCHEFFGNLSANAYSTFATLRAKARQFSVSGGGPLNGTAYWFPCVIDTATGKIIRPAGNIIVYYAADPLDIITPLYLGLRYVGGTNMDDPNETWLQARLDIANAQPGTAGRYQLTSGGFHGYGLRWTCHHVADGLDYTASWFKNANGTDPFGGNCVTGDDLWMQFTGPDCWDGLNLWSDGGNAGYRHVIPKIWDSVKSKWVCPNGWYKLPALVLQIHFTQTGFSDYGNWRLSSDDMEQAKLTALGTPRTINNGESFHSDWFNGWNGATLTEWLTKCLAAAILSGADPHQCDSSAIDDTTSLLTGSLPAAPTGRVPQVQGGPADRVDVSTQHNGPVTVHVHGAMNDNMPMPANDNQTKLANVAPISFDLRRAGR